MSDNTSKVDVIQLIRQQHESLSPSQQKVAEFLVRGGIDVLHYPIAKIAEKVKVNPSTVVRTAQALGFEGFLSCSRVCGSNFCSKRVYRNASS
jgi:DNA-binding MurR/RpiR family transcriptional regulator